MDTWSTDTWDRAYVVLLIVTAWLIPLLIITYCYLKVRWIFVTSLGGHLHFSVLKIFCYTRITRASLKSQQHHSSDLASSSPSSSVRLRYHRSTSTTSKQDYPSPDMFEVVLYTFTVFKNHPKCRIWILAFSTSFWPIHTDLSGNSVLPQALGFQKLAKIDHFWHS